MISSKSLIIKENKIKKKYGRWWVFVLFKKKYVLVMEGVVWCF